MPLVLPTPEQLDAYKEGISDADALQRAGDLFVLATGITETPVDSMEARLVNNAIMEMAWYLQVSHEDKEAAFSPFSSEHIGSYSYSKLQEAVRSGITTGVPAFDLAVSYFGNKDQPDGTYVSSNTEWVFKQTGVPPIPPVPMVYHDPSNWQ